ncbi:MAG: nucleotide exchange factor GrpE [Actinomycetes bacterium]|nr:nucleotide exchange factor GrpE [Actinomycetes bacterium]MDX5400298.1 nucleotide exchange factor GrpE [Actinomycetes bacterium]
MTDAPREHAGEPIIHDTRKIDPDTLKAREQAAGAEPAAGGAAPSDDDAANAPQGGPQDAGLAELKAENAQLAEDLARANASYYNVSQEYTGFVRRSRENASAARQEGIEKVAAALLTVLDDVELARQHGDLEGPFRSVAEKLENLLRTNFELERYGEVGEDFDPTFHEALMDTTSADVETPTVTTVIQPGYRMGEKVLRPARVGVTSPE